jgi:hypothetical protein
MNVPVTFVGSICQVPTVTTNSTDVVVGPVIMTDATGAVVTALGRAASTIFFVKPDARPVSGITVTVDGKTLNQTFDIVIPTPDPNVTSGTVPLGNRTKRGTKVLGGLTVASGATLNISTSDTDTGTVGNQGYLPGVILVKGDVNIAGTLDLKGQNGTNGAVGCNGGDGGTGGPGGAGGGGGGVKEGSCGGASITFQEGVDGGGSSSPVTLPSIQGGTDQTYVLIIATRSNRDVTGVSGGGLTWTERVEQCGGRNQQGIRLWTAQGSPGSSFQAQITYVAGLPLSALLLRYTGVSGFQGPAGENTNGPSGACSGGVDSTNTQLTLTSTTNGSVHVIGDDTRLSDITSSSAGYSQREFHVEGTSGDMTKVYAFDKTFDPAAAHTFQATIASARDWATAGIVLTPGGGTASAAPGAAGRSGGGGGGAKGTGIGAAGGDGTAAVGGAASGTTGGTGGAALPGATGGGGGMANTEVTGGDGGGGGTGDPFGLGGSGATTDGATGGTGGGGGGASGGSPGGGGGGAFATAGTRGPDVPDAGFGGNTTGNAQLVPLSGGSGGAGGGPDVDISSVNRGGGGGGGGGAIQIYATGSVTVTGTITAAGGNGGNGYTSGTDGSGGGGGGSGGAILLQSANVTADGTLTTAGGTAGTSNGNAAGGAGGTGRIRIDGLTSGSSVPGTAGSKFIGPVIDTLVDTTVKGRAEGGSTVTLFVYDSTGAQVSGSPYTTSASGSSGTVGTWTISGITFPSGTGFLAVKQTTGSAQVLGPGRATRGLHLTNWREVY